MKVSIITDSNCFDPSSIVSGCIVVYVSEKYVSFNGINLLAKGYYKINNKEINIFTEQQLLFPSFNLINGCLLSGEYKIPFHFQLPDNIPPSYFYSDDHYIGYKIRVEHSRYLLFNNAETKYISVRNLAQRIPQFEIIRREDTYNKEKNIKLSLFVAQPIISQNLSIKLEIENNSKQNIKELLFSFSKCLTLLSRKNIPILREIIAKERLKKTDLPVVKPNTQGQFTVTLTLPDKVTQPFISQYYILTYDVFLECIIEEEEHKIGPTVSIRDLPISIIKENTNNSNKNKNLNT